MLSVFLDRHEIITVLYRERFQGVTADPEQVPESSCCLLEVKYRLDLRTGTEGELFSGRVIALPVPFVTAKGIFCFW